MAPPSPPQPPGAGAVGPHWNQPGGGSRPSAHPSIAGRERELRDLADAVRRLIHATVVNDASAGETAPAAAELHRVAEGLERSVPAEAPPRYAGLGAGEPHDFFPYDCILGLYNPLALPVRMSWEPPRAVGHAVFGTPYEGPPGCVHGGVLAAAFDQVFNVANIMSRSAGPTVDLRLRYRRATPLHEPLVFEARIESADERRVTTAGRVLCDGQVTVTAQGHFARIDPGRIARGLAREQRERRSGPGAAGRE